MQKIKLRKKARLLIKELQKERVKKKKGQMGNQRREDRITWDKSVNHEKMTVV